MKTGKIFLLTVLFILIVSGCGGGSGGGGGDTAITGDPIWNAWYGVVAESATASFSSLSTASASISTNESALKNVIATESFVTNSKLTFSSAGFSTFNINQDIWNNSSIKYIYLDWASLKGATYYLVYFLGTDGSKNEEVWDSRDTHPNDPTYTNKAFLDLSDELSVFVTDQGEYQFKVIAYNNSYSKEYPVVTVSIGKLLSNIPTGLTCDTTSKELTWTGVAEASGYKVAIYSDPALQTQEWNSGEELLTSTTTTITTSFSTKVLPIGEYYWAAFAYAIQDGKTAEINFAISAFTLK